VAFQAHFDAVQRSEIAQEAQGLTRLIPLGVARLGRANCIPTTTSLPQGGPVNTRRRARPSSGVVSASNTQQQAMVIMRDCLVGAKPLNFSNHASVAVDGPAIAMHHQALTVVVPVADAQRSEDLAERALGETLTGSRASSLQIARPKLRPTMAMGRRSMVIPPTRAR